MNLALRYVKGRGGQAWRDTMVRMEGGAVNGLQRAFLIDWFFVDRTLLSDRKYYIKPEAGGALVQTVTSGPVATYPEIMQGYLHVIMAARKYIYCQTPYFLPTDAVFLALKTAAASGVDVRIMVPRRSDALFVEWPKGGNINLKISNPANWNISLRSNSGWFELEGEIPIDDDIVISASQLLQLVSESTMADFIRLNDSTFLAITGQLRKQLSRI